MRPHIPMLLVAAIAACGGKPAAAVVANAQEQPVAADSVARTRLLELSRAVPGIQLDIRYATANNFTKAPLPGYGVPRAFLRREAAVALARVQARLAARGYGLKVWDGYRPVRATLAMVAWCERTGQTKLLDDGYIARRSRHNQGVAIDLTVVQLATGRELEMGTPFDEFSDRAHTANATGEIASHRKLLGDAMAAEGFVNYESEWWHFSFAVPDPVPFDLPLEQW
ncbi:MAG: M15 family metallopeptidase [Gemmatimonadota bacterium]